MASSRPDIEAANGMMWHGEHMQDQSVFDHGPGLAVQNRQCGGLAA